MLLSCTSIFWYCSVSPATKFRNTFCAIFFFFLATTAGVFVKEIVWNLVSTQDTEDMRWIRLRWCTLKSSVPTCRFLRSHVNGNGKLSWSIFRDQNVTVKVSPKMPTTLRQTSNPRGKLQSALVFTDETVRCIFWLAPPYIRSETTEPLELCWTGSSCAGDQKHLGVFTMCWLRFRQESGFRLISGLVDFCSPLISWWML